MKRLKHLLRGYTTDICKQCYARKSGRNWRNFPRVTPHYVWRDSENVIHFYSDNTEGMTYCTEHKVT